MSNKFDALVFKLRAVPVDIPHRLNMEDPQEPWVAFSLIYLPEVDHRGNVTPVFPPRFFGKTKEEALNKLKLYIQDELSNLAIEEVEAISLEF